MGFEPIVLCVPNVSAQNRSSDYEYQYLASIFVIN